MRNILLTIAYDGSAYAGWQVQPNVQTVQGALERCLQQITQVPCRLRSAGRTDAGVHANGQIANFFTESPLSSEDFARAINAVSPRDIAIRRVQEVPLAFDSRRTNKGKHYRYTLDNARQCDPLWRGRAWHVRSTLDLDKMAEAARRLVGSHDFSAFRAADCQRETTQRTLYRCSVATSGNRVMVDVDGTAFLKHMVRVIVGTLVEVAVAKRHPDCIAELLEGGDRTKSGRTAPAHGLCLLEVFLK